MPIHTLIVDDHEATRIGLSHLLQSSGFSITATAADGEDALHRLRSAQVDLILADVQMQGMDGLALLISLREEDNPIPVVLMSAHDSPIYVARAAANGAQDYLLKDDSVETIQQTLEHVCNNGHPLPQGRLDRVQQKLAQPIRAAELPPEFPLTNREAQVLRHIAFGLSNREISNSLGISIETVKEHVQNILRKMDASDRTDAAVRAVRGGLV
ncbi:response regulator transcription factor [Roseiconus nitratireducens]|uniref:Response regulator transcription factor n=1 Tax=Roseiconus nitratireducens TaxID=2605748 RepID=A0A5M6D9P8_9BACT|nr:response regulator transcription factor [Roseiconus nitratireducens]KAA5544277.1 response regulator transcription factor [Roseiconus nitratireducens]